MAPTHPAEPAVVHHRGPAAADAGPGRHHRRARSLHHDELGGGQRPGPRRVPHVQALLPVQPQAQVADGHAVAEDGEGAGDGAAVGERGEGHARGAEHALHAVGDGGVLVVEHHELEVLAAEAGDLCARGKGCA